MSCSKALKRLEGIYSGDSIVHIIIQQALDLSCSDENTVFVVPLNNPEIKEDRQRNEKLYFLLRWLRYGFLVDGGGNLIDAPLTWVTL